jgi:hypothetical protein
MRNQMKRSEVERRVRPAVPRRASVFLEGG